MNVLRHNFKWAFSEYQYNVIYLGYGKDSETFKEWKGLMGMSFSKPESMGFVDSNGMPVTDNRTCYEKADKNNIVRIVGCIA